MFYNSLNLIFVWAHNLQKQKIRQKHVKTSQVSQNIKTCEFDITFGTFAHLISFFFSVSVF